MKLSKSGVWFGVCALFVLPFFAHAHATPVSYAPAASETVLEAPASISVRFTERIEVGASSLTVFGPDGETVNRGKGTLLEDDARVLHVPIERSGEGVYTVSWQVVSVDDGHFTKGAYSFLVDATGRTFEGGEGTVEINYSSKVQEAISSFLSLIGESLFVAVMLFLFALRFSLGRDERVRKLYAPLFVHLVGIGSMFFACGVIVSMVRKSGELSAVQGTIFSEAFMTYLSSSAGTFSVLKLFACVALVLLFIVFRRSIASGSISAALLSVFGFLLASILYLQAQISHAAASLFFPHLSIGVTFVHLLAKELVIGGILALLACFAVSLQKRALTEYARLCRWFDAAASLSLLFAGVSGTYIVWLHLKHIDHLFTTQWGELFLVLLFSTAALGALRLFHQCIINPRLGHAGAVRIYSLSLPLEALLALCVLFFSGYISMTTPPFTVEQFTYSASEVSEGVAITFSVHPYEHDAFLLRFTDTETGAPVALEDLVLTATNSERGIGPNVLAVEQRSRSGYAFKQSDLSPAGAWQIQVVAQKESGYDAHAQFELAYPDEVVSSKQSDDMRSFDTFAAYMLALCAALTFLFGVLFVYALRSIRVHSEKEISIKTERFFPATFFFSGAIAAVLFAAFCVALSYATTSDFKRLCLEDGHVWKQAFPTRDFDATSPNAVVGCTVHDGHFHIVDEEEYRFLREAL